MSVAPPHPARARLTAAPSWMLQTAHTLAKCAGRRAMPAAVEPGLILLGSVFARTARQPGPRRAGFAGADGALSEFTDGVG